MTLREQGRFILPVGMRLCDIGTAEVPFSSEQRRGSEVKLPAVSLIVKSIENDNFPGNF